MSEPLDPRLELARYGKNRSGDKFVGFWVALYVAGRQRRDARRAIKDLFRGDTGAAIQALGAAPVAAQLRNAAEVFVSSCLRDPSYTSSLFGLKRLEDDEVLGRLANETVAALAALADSGLTGDETLLPDALIGGYEDALGPASLTALRSAAARRPAVARLLRD